MKKNNSGLFAQAPLCGILQWLHSSFDESAQNSKAFFQIEEREVSYIPLFTNGGDWGMSFDQNSFSHFFLRSPNSTVGDSAVGDSAVEGSAVEDSV